MKLLKKVNGIINIGQNTLEFATGIVPLKFDDKFLNHINIENSENKYVVKLRETLRQYQGIFTPQPNYLPFNTQVECDIPTSHDDAIWSKQYPYPQSANTFINSEIKTLLENGIIRPSRSPYNNPIWVVDKKGINPDGSKKFRLVIDFKKLNSATKTIKYPMAETSIILSNLGRGKYFTTIDLQSGFHQIKMKEEDIKKTAFSVNNGKYEYLRMPFGLKNAPAIFQAAMDDILRPYVGKFCHVYIDDVIIFSESAEEHLTHIETIIKALSAAHMTISNEKSIYFKEEVKFLGYVISHNCIKTDPDKVKTINEYPEPTTIRQLRSFLGMSGYYRKFIQNYAHIAKPLTQFLRGIENNKRKTINIEFTSEAKKAFEQIKKKLLEQVLLNQPDFSKGFELTTDASNSAIGAVLSQEGKPITFISRTLSETEQGYATNEKELLAIVWALSDLRNYLYGHAGIKIYTDHQPLTFSISNKNPNAKLKRWRAFIEEFSPEIIYKPGKENVVADALSRQNLNHLPNSDIGTCHSAESSQAIDIPRVNKKLNQFKNQIHFLESNINNIKSTQLHGKFWRHQVEFKDSNIVKDMKEIIHSNVNAIYCTEETLFKIKKDLLREFPNSKFIHTSLLVKDMEDKEEQIKIIKETHSRAHREAFENYKHITREYFWPLILPQVQEYVKLCENCKLNKYDRHPKKQEIGETPIPRRGGERIHADIYYTHNKMFLTAVDSFSKYLIALEVENKIHAKETLINILPIFGAVETVVTDNEKTFCSEATKLDLTRLGIKLYNTPVNHSTTNGMIEKVHSTLTELIRLDTYDNPHQTIEQLMPHAIKQYNETIHSITNEKPNEIFHNYEKYSYISDLIKEKQGMTLHVRNKDRHNKVYKENDIVFEKSDRRQTKGKPIYVKRKVKQNNKNTVIDSKNKVIHKDNLRS